MNGEQHTASAASRELTPEQQTIADFRGIIKEKYAALNKSLRAQAEGIEDPAIRSQIEKRLDTHIAETDKVLSLFNTRLRTDGRKFSAQGEAFLKGRFENIQRKKEPLVAHAKILIARVSNIEKTLQGEDSPLAIRLESCGQQTQIIQSFIQHLEGDTIAIEEALDSQNTQQLSLSIKTLERNFLYLKKNIEELDKTLEDFFSETQDPREKKLNEERQDLDERIKNLILEITHFKAEFDEIGERVTTQRTPERTDLYGSLKIKIQDLEKRIGPLEELTAHSSDDATTHDMKLIEDDNQIRFAFLEETQAVFDEAMQLYARLAESFKLKDETTIRHIKKEPTAQTAYKERRETWWDRIKKNFK